MEAFSEVVTTPLGGVDAVVAGNGTLVYVPGTIESAVRTLVWVERFIWQTSPQNRRTCTKRRSSILATVPSIVMSSGVFYPINSEANGGSRGRGDRTRRTSAVQNDGIRNDG